MSTQLVAYLDHRLGPDDIDAIVHLLNRHVTATRDIEDYWRSQAPHWQLRNQSLSDPTWRNTTELDLCPTEIFQEGELEFGTDSVSICFYSRMACMWSKGRFRGFLSIPEHRRVHRQVAHQLAAGLHSTAIAWLSEMAFDGDVLIDALGMDAVLSSLNAEMGPPQESVETISDEVITDAQHTVPEVWYLERPPFTMAAAQ